MKFFDETFYIHGIPIRFQKERLTYPLSTTASVRISVTSTAPAFLPIVKGFSEQGFPNVVFDGGTHPIPAPELNPTTLKKAIENRPLLLDKLTKSKRLIHYAQFVQAIEARGDKPVIKMAQFLYALTSDCMLTNY